MSRATATRHPSYNNRFRSTSTDSNDNGFVPAATATPAGTQSPVHSVSHGVTLFGGHPTSFGPLARSDSLPTGPQYGTPQQENEQLQNMPQQHFQFQPLTGTTPHGSPSPQSEKQQQWSRHQSAVQPHLQPLQPGTLHHEHSSFCPITMTRSVSQGEGEGGQGSVRVDPPLWGSAQRPSDNDVTKPVAAGLPRRVSRQLSADLKRQQFAVSRTTSGGAVTSVDSGCDDVFVEMGGEAAATSRAQHYALHDSSLFPDTQRSRSAFSSTSTTASILPNPYNRFNHSVHDLLWCCSCVHFVFFCCLPAIHYMEQSDVEHNRNNGKRARRLARLSTFFFCLGSLVAVSLLALVFFLAIFLNLS